MTVNEVLDEEAKRKLRSLHLDGTLLELGPEDEAFFKAETRIQDTEELRKHIIGIQEDAYEVYPYPCIRGFGFAELKIARIPAYPRVLELAKSRPGAILLDIGCCVGTEVRRSIHDGWPMLQAIATDIEAGFWDVGHKLFRTTSETYPVKFLAGDIFDDAYLSPTASVPYGVPPPVSSVNTLTELRGHTSVISISSFFHMFDEERQLELGKRLAVLLDPRPGSTIFGSHVTQPVKGEFSTPVKPMFCHSPESWTKMWEEEIFEKGQVKVDTILEEENMDLEGAFPGEVVTKFYWLFWSVERL